MVRSAHLQIELTTLSFGISQVWKSGGKAQSKSRRYWKAVWRGSSPAVTLLSHVSGQERLALHGAAQAGTAEQHGGSQRGKDSTRDVKMNCGAALAEPGSKRLGRIHAREQQLPHVIKGCGTAELLGCVPSSGARVRHRGGSGATSAATSAHPFLPLRVPPAPRPSRSAPRRSRCSRQPAGGAGAPRALRSRGRAEEPRGGGAGRRSALCGRAEERRGGQTLGIVRPPRGRAGLGRAAEQRAGRWGRAGSAGAGAGRMRRGGSGARSVRGRAATGAALQHLYGAVRSKVRPEGWRSQHLQGNVE